VYEVAQNPHGIPKIEEFKSGGQISKEMALILQRIEKDQELIQKKKLKH